MIKISIGRGLQSNKYMINNAVLFATHVIA